MLKIMGRELSTKGILTVEQIPAAIAALQAAVVSAEAAEALTLENAPEESDPDAADPTAGDDNVSLRSRVTPLIALLRNSALAGEDVTWGV